MHLKIRQIEVFHAVLEAGSITRAAEQLNLTQPAVSLALSSFETELGFTLFHRSRGFFAPTAEARLLAEDTEQSLMSLNRVATRAKAIRSGTTGSISIASNGAAAINLMPSIIAAFQRTYPDVTVNLMIRTSRKIASWAASHQIDIGIIDAPVPVPGTDAKLFRLPCVCIMHRDDPLAAEPTIQPDMLDGRVIISITGDHAIDRKIDELCILAGATHRRMVSCGYFAIARNLVNEGAGIAIVDAMNGGAVLNDDVIAKPFEPEINFELALIRPNGQSPTQPLQSFVDLVANRLTGIQRN